MPKYLIEVDTTDKTVSFTKDGKNIKSESVSVSFSKYKEGEGKFYTYVDLSWSNTEDGPERVSKSVSMSGYEGEELKVRASKKTLNDKEAAQILANLLVKKPCSGDKCDTDDHCEDCKE